MFEFTKLLDIVNIIFVINYNESLYNSTDGKIEKLNDIEHIVIDNKIILTLFLIIQFVYNPFANIKQNHNAFIKYEK